MDRTTSDHDLDHLIDLRPPATDPVMDFWNSSSLHEYNAREFGGRIGAFTAPGVNAPKTLATSGAAISMRPVRDQLQRLLRSRRSERKFGTRPISRRHVERILAAAGAGRGGRPLAPSAGGLASVQTYAIAMNASGALGGNAFRYDAETHSAFIVGPAPSPMEARRIFQLDCVGEPQLLVVFVLDLSVLLRRYGDRALRFSMQEVGHVAQNVSLRLARGPNRGYIVGGGMDHEVLDVLGLGQTTMLYGGAIVCGR